MLDEKIEKVRKVKQKHKDWDVKEEFEFLKGQRMPCTGLPRNDCLSKNIMSFCHAHSLSGTSLKQEIK